MFRYSVQSYDEIIREFGSGLNGFLPVLKFNLTERGQQLSPSDEGSPKQFAKGYDRLKSWLNLAGLNPNPRYSDLSFFWNPTTNEMVPIKSIQSLDKFQRYFCLSALIICFQVFGDGNHRAANYFFKSKLGRDLNLKEREIIETMYRTFDYSLLAVERYDYFKLVNYILGDLIQGLVKRLNELPSSSVSGGNKKTTHNYKRKYKIKIKNARNNTIRANKRLYKVKPNGYSRKYKYSKRKIVKNNE